MNEITKMRRRLVREIKALVTPLFWDSGYLKDLDPRKGIFGGTRPFRLWAPKDRYGNLIDSVKLGGMVLKEIGGISEDGPIVYSYAGGLVSLAYSEIPVEDMIKLKRWLEKAVAAVEPDRSSS